MVERKGEPLTNLGVRVTFKVLPGQRQLIGVGERSHQFREPFIGTQQEVLIEDGGVGYTGQFLKVELSLPKEALVGQLLPVEVTGLTQSGLRASLLN